MLFFLINLTLAGDEIDLCKRDYFGFKVELVSGPENEEGGNSNVGGDEGVDLEGDKCVIAFEKRDDCGCNQGEVCTPWLEWCLVGQRITRIALKLESFHEPNMAPKDAHPSDGAEGGGQVNEPTEDSLATGGEVEVYKKTKGDTEDEGRVRNAQAINLLEDFWSFSFDGKTVKSAGANVQVGVCSAQYEDEDGTVDNMVKNLDTNQSGGDNEGGCSGPGLLGVGYEKGRIGSRDYETDNENTADIEDQDSPEGPLDRDWDVLPGILSLANGNADEFGSHVGEKSVDECRPETEEGSEALPVRNLLVKVLAQRTVRRIPVSETNSIMFRISSKINDDTHQDQCDQGDDLDARKPELQFPEHANAEEVDKEDKGDEDDHPNAGIDLAATMPVLEDGAGGVNVVWGNDEIFHEIIVSKSESNGRVHETGGISRETTFMGNVCGHFTERNHDEVTNKANKAISDKDTERATPDETSARSNNETSSYCTSEGDHGNLSGTEASVESLIALWVDEGVIDDETG